MTTSLFADVFGSHIDLIKLDMKYLDDMWEYSRNPKMYEHFEFGPQKSISDTKNYLCKLIKRSNGVDAHWWFIKIKKSEKVVGSIGVHDIDFYKSSCEISYGLSPNFWGKGVFIEALNLALKRLIKDFNFYRITAVTSSENVRSIEALKKLSFKKEGEFRDFYLKDNGKRYNATSLALIAPDFLKFQN